MSRPSALKGDSPIPPSQVKRTLIWYALRGKAIGWSALQDILVPSQDPATMAMLNRMFGFGAVSCQDDVMYVPVVTLNDLSEISEEKGQLVSLQKVAAFLCSGRKSSKDLINFVTAQASAT